MDGIIDLAAERNKREAPDPDQVQRDAYGREMYRFLLSYDYGNKEWCSDVWAYDHDDAVAKVAAMRASLRVDGQCYGVIPA